MVSSVDSIPVSMAGFTRALWSLGKGIYTLESIDAARRGGKVFTALVKQDIVDETTLMLERTTIKVHQHAAGGQKGA